MTNRMKLSKDLTYWANRIGRYGLDSLSIEEGQLAYMLRESAALIKERERRTAQLRRKLLKAIRERCVAEVDASWSGSLDANDRQHCADEVAKAEARLTKVLNEVFGEQ